MMTKQEFLDRAQRGKLSAKDQFDVSPQDPINQDREGTEKWKRTRSVPLKPADFMNFQENERKKKLERIEFDQ